MLARVRARSHPHGTTIEVRDLFFNVPARRKFVRSDATEFGHIARLVERLVLSRFDVALGCAVAAGAAVDAPARWAWRVPDISSGAADARIAACWARTFRPARCRSITRRARFRSRAGSGCPPVSRATADQQYWFVNGRGVRDRF